MDAVTEIDEALAAHWRLMGREPPARLHDEDGLLWFETPIRSLPYNGVIRSHLPDGPAADARIAAVLDRFRARGAQCLWFTGARVMPPDLGARLEAHGLAAVERTTYMSRDLDAPFAAADSPAAIAEVGEPDLDAYTALTAAYWEIAEDERRLVAEFQRRLRPGHVPGVRFLARLDGEPVGRAYLSLAGPAGVAGVFGMSVLPHLRGQRIASALTAALLERARTEGCRRVVLQSSDIARNVYRRAGFAEHAEVPVYASAAIWSGDH